MVEKMQVDEESKAARPDWWDASDSEDEQEKKE
jgi:hypothetical protein